MVGSNLTRYRDAGLLLLRVGIGAAFIAHGWPKLAGGPHMWIYVGHMGGFYFLPAVWGLVAGLVEFFGGILLALGFAFRPVCVVLFIQMMVALSTHLRAGQGYGIYSHPLEIGILFLSLILIGPGKYSIDKK